MDLSNYIFWIRPKQLFLIRLRTFRHYKLKIKPLLFYSVYQEFPLASLCYWFILLFASTFRLCATHYLQQSYLWVVFLSPSLFQAPLHMIFYSLRYNPQIIALFYTQRAWGHTQFPVYSLPSPEMFWQCYLTTVSLNSFYFAPNNFKPSEAGWWQYFKFLFYSP